jgi:GntR family transcriptional regulator
LVSVYIVYTHYLFLERDYLNITISHSSKEPIYQQIIDQIRDQILKGAVRPGDPLPSIRQLARDLRVSVITTKRAYEELEREGLIRSVVGKGSYIAPGNTMDTLREQRISQLRYRLQQLVEEAAELGLSREELITWVLQCDGEDQES